MASKCKECGCICTRCIQNDRRHSDMHLHAEIENLRQRLMEQDNHIVTMETQFLNEADKFPNGELASLKDELLIWQDKYTRLYEAHKRVQKVNQNLEDKLLRIVDKCETEKGAFTKDIATLSHRLADANYTIHRLTQDNEKYRNDVNLAIQLLQCKPSNFIGQKYESLPPEVQAKVRTYIAQKGPSSEYKSSDVRSITVPISTFPPTAMVYNVTRTSIQKYEDSTSDDPKPPVDVVSAAIMAKVLEDREKERIFARHCETCSCHRSVLKVDSEVQTMNTLESSSCECQGRQDMSRGEDFFEDGDRVTDRKYQLKYDRATRQYKQSRDSYSNSIFSEANEYSKTSNKVRTQNSDSSVRHTIYQFVNEVAEVKNNQKVESFKTSSRSIGSRSYSSLRNSTKHQNSLNSHNITAETMLLAPENFEGKEEKADSVKGSKKFNHWSDAEKVSMKGRAAQVEIINDRLWKSSWTSETLDFQEHGVDHRIRSGKDTQIDVINERLWKNSNKSKTKEAKPTQLTLIEVASADESVNNSEMRPAESTVSPSFSSDSVIFSTSDPSSISSDVVQSKGLSKQDKKNCNADLKAGKQERTSGPRNCLMRVSGKSNNILLDNVGNYQPLLYANTIGIPNTAMVHATSSCRSGRTVSTSSEENSSVLSSDNVQLQRVAEWVKSSVQPDKASVPFSKPSLRFDKATASEIKIDAKHLDRVSRDEVPEIESKNLADECKSSESLQKDAQKKEKDLITFDPSSDEEKDPNIVNLDLSKADCSPEVDYEVKITKEMEETYLKLTASLDPVALRLSSLTGPDLTIEKYRKDHKRLQTQKVPAKSGSTT